MKSKIISIMFLLLISVIMFTNLISPNMALSYGERRALTQRPSFTPKSVFSGNFDTAIESYAIDQFAGRDEFRTIKALADLKLFGKLDNNNLYVHSDYIFKQEYPLNSQSVLNMSKKLDKIYDLYLKNCNVVLGIIPSKSQFIAKTSGHLFVDYDDITSSLLSSLNTPVSNVTSEDTLHKSSINYLDLKSLLRLEDYYRTDLHWRQDGLSNVVSSIGDLFGFSTAYDIDIPSNSTYSYQPFYGAYYGQSALKLPSDTLLYSEDIYTKNAIVTDYDEEKKEPATSIYNNDMLGSIDSYDVFFSGNSPLITVENPLCKTDKELIIFRDSFGSSLAPLLLEGYSKMTLIDLRFLPIENVGAFVDFTNQDVLILYNQEVVNNSDMIK